MNQQESKIMIRQDGNKVLDEESLSEASELLTHTLDLLEELQNHPALIKREREGIDDIHGDISEFHDNVDARESIARTNWEDVESSLEHSMEELNLLKDELPDEMEADRDDAVLRVVEGVESATREIHEALTAVGDIREYE